MISEFFNFVQELFPSISPYTKESVKKAIEQFNIDSLEWFMPSIIDNLSQGDIIDCLPFSFIDENGNEIINLLKGIVLSNSCDIDNHDYIVIAPLFEIKDVLKNEDSINKLRKNQHYDKMCFTNSYLDNMFVDFSKSSSFNTSLIKKLLNGKTKVQYSLNQYGYYLLLTKLTIYFLRPEDKENNDLRNIALEISKKIA